MPQIWCCRGRPLFENLVVYNLEPRLSNDNFHYEFRTFRRVSNGKVTTPRISLVEVSETVSTFFFSFFWVKFKKWVEIFQKHYYQFMAGIIMQRTALNYFHCRSFANIIIITIINKCWYLFYRSCDKIGPLWRLVRLVQKPSIFSNNAYYQLFFIYKGQYQKKIAFFFRESRCVFFFSGWNNAFDSPWGRR